jgi:hypothetical protein
MHRAVHFAPSRYEEKELEKYYEREEFDWKVASVRVKNPHYRCASILPVPFTH